MRHRQKFAPARPVQTYQVRQGLSLSDRVGHKPITDYGTYPITGHRTPPWGFFL